MHKRSRVTATMASSPAFTVRRRAAVLVPPLSHTPNELKPLSDIDDQQTLRNHVSFIHYYRAQPSMITSNTDPAKVIRGALAEALVFYYPLAGRLREGPDNKLLVDCTAEGVLFIESDADVRLDDFGDALTAPVPCLDELLPGTVGITGCPLLLIQLTRLLCGGFILALRVNHTITDGLGMVQFLSAMAEIARGAAAPSVLPVWERHLLSARVPPRITHAHPEFDVLPAVMASVPADMVHRSFFFTKSEVSKLKCYSPSICSTFDVLAASLWRSRTAALRIEPDDEVRLYFSVNARGRFESMVTVGYYGNAFVYPAVISTAGELCGRSLGYAIELIRKAKDSVTADFMRSVVDLMVLRGRPPFAMADMEHTCFISDNTRTGFDELDFGWGKPVFGGTAEGGFQEVPGLLSMFVRFKDRKGEEGVVVPVCLPKDSMERFVVEIEGMIGGNIKEPHKHE